MIFQILIVLLVIFYIWSQRRNYFVFWKIGGPFGWPIFGVALQFLDPNNILENLDKIRKKYGKFGGSWLGPNFVVWCSEPGTMKQVLNSYKCIDKTEFFAALDDLMKNGILLAKGKKWHERRKLLNPAFSNEILVDFFPVYNEVIGALVEKLEEFENQGEVDLEEIVSKGMLEIACQTTMGTKVDLLDNSNFLFFKHFYKELEILTRKLATPWYQNKTIYRLSKLWKLEMRYIRTVKDFTRQIISEKRLETLSQGTTDDATTLDMPEKPKAKRIFVDQIFHFADKRTISWDDIDDEVTTVLLTAADTLTSLTNMAILCLAMYPECQERLRDEIFEIFPAVDDEDFTVTNSDLNNMPYLEMVLNETLRFMPPIPLLFRNVSEDFELNEQRVMLPKGTQIILDIFHMHRDTEIWGPKAEEFWPEHFAAENFSKMPPFAFVPYSKGVRSCIGMKYSRFVAKILLIKILHRFRIKTSTKLEDLKYRVAISLKLQGEAKVELERL